MISRRHFLRTSTVYLATISAAVLGMTGAYRDATAQGNGKGRGNGSSGGNGNGNGSGSNGGKGDRGTGKGSKDRSTPDPSTSRVGGNAGDGTSEDVSSLRIRHRTGIEETIANGRFIMRDKWGRTIINRIATSADRVRLKSLID